MLHHLLEFCNGSFS